MIRNIVMGIVVVILLGAVAVGFYDSARGPAVSACPNGTISQPQGQGAVKDKARSPRVVRGKGRARGKGMVMAMAEARVRGMAKAMAEARPGARTRHTVEHTWVTLNGTVVAFDGQQTLTVDTTERGSARPVAGTGWFCRPAGITFTAGDAVTILGFEAPTANSRR